MTIDISLKGFVSILELIHVTYAHGTCCVSILSYNVVLSLLCLQLHCCVFKM